MNRTINDKRIIGANNLHEIQTYVNSSHDVHMDVRGNTGGFSIFGIRVLKDRSSKQELNSRSSNESEVI